MASKVQTEAQTKVKGERAEYCRNWMKVVWLAVVRTLQ